MRLKRLLPLLLFTFFALTLSYGCRCGEKSQENQEEKLRAGAMPMRAHTAAEKLAQYVPSDVDGVVFVASYGAIVESLERIKGWGLLDAKQVEGVLFDLGRHHGLNPGQLTSYQQAGFAIDGGLAVGMLGKNPFVVLEIEDIKAFERFLDTFINEEYGRPRNQESQFHQHTLINIRVLKRDLATMVVRGRQVLLVAGPHLKADADPSPQVMERLLSIDDGQTLAAQATFKRLLDKVADDGAFFVYSSKIDLARTMLQPILSKQPEILAAIEAMLSETITAVGISLRLDTERIEVTSFTLVPEAALSHGLGLLTPPVASTAALATFLGEEVNGALRLSFSPREIEAYLLATSPLQAKLWQDLKRMLTVRMVMNFETDILYNLTGQGLATLYRIDEDRLRGASDLRAVLQCIDAAFFLPMADPNRANGYFGKINMLKGFLPEGQISIEERQGVLLFTIREKRQVLLRLAYHQGVLAVITGDLALEKVLQRLTAPPQQAASFYLPLMQEGALWAAAIDMRQIVAMLSARFDIVSFQIAKFFAPIDRLLVRTRLEEDGLALSLSVDISHTAGSTAKE